MIRSLVLPLCLLPAISLAANVGPTKTFNAGETLTATDLNGNFSAHETAINDNNAAITAIQPALRVSANGTPIGTLISADSLSILSDKDYLFRLNQDGTLAGTAVYYASTDCTGPAYIPVNSTSMFFGFANSYVAASAYDGTVFYIQEGTVAIPGFTYNSFGFNLGGPSCSTQTGTTDAYPTLPNDPTLTGVENSYTLPIRIAR